MKAAVFGLAKQIDVKEVPDPVMDENHVLIRVKKTAICGSDKHSFDDGSAYNMIPGHEYVGIVVDPGAREDLKAGDRVTSVTQNPCGKCAYCLEGRDNLCAANGQFVGGPGLDGAFAELLAARKDLVMKVADNVSDTNAALAEPVAVMLHAIRQSGIQAGGKLLIRGVGALTAFAAQLAKAMGVSMVVAIGGSEKRCQPLIDNGDVDVFVKTGTQGFYTKMMELTDGGFDAYIDNKGDAKGMNECLAVLKRGRIGVIAGIDQHDTSRLNTFDVQMSDVFVAGSYAYTIAEYAEVLDMMKQGKINPEVYGGKAFPLDEITDAFNYASARSTTDLKVFVEP